MIEIGEEKIRIYRERDRGDERQGKRQMEIGREEKIF